MSAIPPNWLGSVIQSGGAQSRASADRAKIDSTQSKTTEPFQHDLIDAIQNGDSDSRTDSEAAGQGGQGRAWTDGEQPPDQMPEKDATEQAGGLDIEA